MRALAPFVVCTMLTGCAGRDRVEFPSHPVTLGDFIQQIKHEVGAFEQQKAAHPAQGHCANQFDLVTSAVTASVATVNRRKQSGEVSAEIPLGVGSLGPNVSGSQTITGSQTISFTVLPQETEVEAAKMKVAPASAKFEGTPLQDALLALYRGFADNSDYDPCLAFGDVEEQQNTIDYGFKIEQSRTVGGKVKLYLFALGASDERNNSIENKLKVKFTLKGVSVTQ